MSIENTVEREKKADTKTEQNVAAQLLPGKEDKAKDDLIAPEVKKEKKQQSRVDKNGKPIRDFVSIGERIHNEITYRGVDWIMNSTFGVAFAFITHRTTVGRKYFTTPVKKAFTALFEPFVTNKKALEGSVGWGATFLSIMFGGTVTIPPVMALENPKNKIPIIKKLDTWIYGKDHVENDPKFQQAYEEVKHQPKKDFGTGMNTRFIALAPLLAITVYEPTHKFVTKHFYDHIATGTKFVASKLGIGKTAYWAGKNIEGVEKMTAAELKKVPTNWNYLHEVIAFDFGLTVFYSVLHELAYKFFARKEAQHEKQQVKKFVHEHPNVEFDKKELPSPVEEQAKPNVELQDKPIPLVKDVTRQLVLETQQPSVQLS